MSNLQKIDILMPVGEKGGVENVVGKTAVYLMNRGYQVRVVQLVWEQVRWVPETVEFHPLLEGKGHYSLNQFAEKYSEFLHTHGEPDLIIATTWPMMVLVAKLAFLAVSHAHGKIIAWPHGPLEQYVKAGFGGMECLEKADAVFVLNRRTEAMLKRNPNCREVNIVRNPVDFTKCHIQEQTSTEELRLLFVGRLSVEKRLDFVLDALISTKAAWKLRIIGDGDERGALEKKVQELSLQERVEFYGWQQNPWKYADQVTATVLSSSYECFPMAAVESLACGIPVIAPPVDGIAELIKPGSNGYIYSGRDSNSLTHILDTIALGETPVISPEQCRESVLHFEESQALKDFEEKMKGVLDKISVIIPCYNVQNRIAKCLDSVFGQQPCGANLEVICIDDKSTDDTLKVLKEYEKNHSENMMLVMLEENGRQGNARNIGMQYASGNYISFVDADDFIAPMMMKSLYQKAADTQCDVVECAYKQIRWEDSLTVEEQGNAEYYDMQNINHKKSYILKYGWKTGPWGRLYRRDFLLNHQIYFPTDTFMEDIYFSERCMLYMERYVRIPQTCYFYCENTSGVMHSEKIIDYYMDTATVQIGTTESLIQEGRLAGCEEEYAYLHFSKAFAEPVSRMWKDERYFSFENFNFLKDSLFRLFPNITQNPYYLRDKSKTMELYRILLEKNWTEPELRSTLQNWKP